jgi:hypothetical protein
MRRVVAAGVLALAGVGVFGTPASAGLLCNERFCVEIACLPVLCPSYPDLYCYNDGSIRFCV